MTLQEFNSKFIHKKGALAAARMPDGVNPNKESSGSQFYIVQGVKFKKVREGVFKKLGDENAREVEAHGEYTSEQYKIYETIGGTPHLDMEYTIFGEVVEGLDVLDKIAAVKTGRGNRPKEDVVMTIKIVKKWK